MNILRTFIAVLFLSLFFFQCWKKKVGIQSGKKAEIEGWSQFEHQMTANPYTGEVPRNSLISAQKNIQLRNIFRSFPAPLTWDERGPSNVGGRTRVLLFDASDTTSNTVFAGSVSGGLWISRNFLQDNVTWQPIDDFLPNLAISSLVQDPTNLDIFYLGTGEGWLNGDAARGAGIWKSTNHGITWDHLKSTDNSNYYYIQKLLIDKNGHLYASTFNVGIVKSKNGGQSWIQVVGTNVGQGNSNRGADLEQTPNGDIYATVGLGTSLGSVHISRFELFDEQTGDRNTWSEITPDGDYNRIEILTSPLNYNYVYILCEGENTDDVTKIFRSLDNGRIWKEAVVPSIFDGGRNSVFTREQAWYNLTGTLHPTDSFTAFIGGIDALKTNDRGISWDQISSWIQSFSFGFKIEQYVHADQHNMQFVPNDYSKFVITTDGGIFLSENIDTIRGKPNYRNLNHNYNVTQFYSCALHPTAGSNYYLAGSQDNGTQRFSQEGINETHRLRGGDGGFCHIDQQNPDIQIASFIYSDYSITGTNWNSFQRINLGNKSGKFINPTDYDSQTRKLYCSYDANTLVRIDDVGNKNNVKMIPLSLDSGEVSAVFVHPGYQNQVWIGASRNFYKDLELSKGRPMILKLDSANTQNPIISEMTIPGLPIAAYVRSIEASLSHPNKILVTISNYGVNSVWLSRNGGITWENKEGNLPDIPIRWGIFNPTDDNIVLLGTELGVMQTFDITSSSVNWQSGNKNLANTRVDMLQYRTSDNLIAAATHGRGLFTTSSLNKSDVHFALSELTLHEANVLSPFDGCTNPSDTFVIPISLSETQNDTTILKFSSIGDSKLNQDFYIDSILKINPGIGTGWLKLIFYNDQLLEEIENTQISLMFDKSKFGSSGYTLDLTILDDEKDPYSVFGTAAYEKEFIAFQEVPASSIWHYNPDGQAFKTSIYSDQNLGCTQVSCFYPQNQENLRKALKGFAIGKKWNNVIPEINSNLYILDIFYSAEEINSFQTPLNELNILQASAISDNIDTSHLLILKDIERKEVNDSVYVFSIMTQDRGSFTLTNSPSLDSISTSVNKKIFDFSSSIFPNPSHGDFRLILKDSKNRKFTLKLYDISGNSIPISYSLSGINEWSIQVIDEYTGIAILQLLSGNKLIGSGKTLIFRN